MDGGNGKDGGCLREACAGLSFRGRLDHHRFGLGAGLKAPVSKVRTDPFLAGRQLQGEGHGLPCVVQSCPLASRVARNQRVRSAEDTRYLKPRRPLSRASRVRVVAMIRTRRGSEGSCVKSED